MSIHRLEMMKPKKRIEPLKYVAWILHSACQRCTNWTAIRLSCIHLRSSSPNSSHLTLASKCRRPRKRSCVDSLNWWILRCWRMCIFWICCSDCRFSMWRKWISKWWRRSSLPILAIQKPKLLPVYRSQPSPTSPLVLSCPHFLIDSKWRNDSSSSCRFFSLE